MKRPTEIQAAKIEAKIEGLRHSAAEHDNRGLWALARHERQSAAAMEREYWDACGLSADVRAQLEARSGARA